MPAFGTRSFEEEKAAIIRFCSDEKPDDSDLVVKVGRLHTELRSTASREALNDQEVALACLRLDIRFLEYFSEEFRADRDFVLAAANHHGLVLQHASEELRADKEVVLTAVKKHGYALSYASEGLTGDKEVVLAAVSNNGLALGDASEELRGDMEVVLAAVSNYGRALSFATDAPRNDKAFLLLVARCANGLGPNAYYSEAGPSVKQVLSEKEFCLAADSKLAVAGQPEPAPTLLVTLTRVATVHIGNSGDNTFHIEAMLGLSGEKFVVDLPAGYRPDSVVVNDLAEELVKQLRQAGKMGKKQEHVFITFLIGDVPVIVSPWECQRPLTHYLPARP